MIVGCYTIHLYCDDPECIHMHDLLSNGQISIERYETLKSWWDDEYTGEIESECKMSARRRGWLVSQKRQLCPIHSGE